MTAPDRSNSLPMTLSLASAHRLGLELARHHARRLVAHVAALDRTAWAEPVPGSGWTVADTVVHVQSVVLRYTADLRRATTPSGVAEQNAADLDRLGGDVDAALAAILEQVDGLAAVVDLVAPDQLLPFHAGQAVTLAGGWGNLLGEVLAHGDDIARATGTAFTVPDPDLEVLWRFTAPVLQGWLRPPPAGSPSTASWRLAFPFGELDAVIDGSRLAWGADLVAAPDHRIDVADVASFTLAFPYGRRTPGDPTTAGLAGRFLPL